MMGRVEVGSTDFSEASLGRIRRWRNRGSGRESRRACGDFCECDKRIE